MCVRQIPGPSLFNRLALRRLLPRLLQAALLLLLLSGSSTDRPGPSAANIRDKIETLAGGGSVGDGGAAMFAQFNLPGGVTEAPNGDVIVVDFGNHRVRRIDHTTGIIETIAGTGEAGFNGDGIPAAAAQLSRPEQAVFGPSGDLFIADSYNNRIRRIDHSTGLISTVAGTGNRGGDGDGGPAAAAELHFPEGLAVDNAGNVFIADTVNRRVRRVDAGTGVITTFAGTGDIGVSADGTTALQARFLRLARIAIGPTGDLYIADSPAHRIYVVDAVTRQIRTFAGTGKSGFTGDGGPARQAQLSFPEGLMIAANADVYFADVANHRVRRINAANGVINTVAGTGDRGFSGDGQRATMARLWSPGRVWLDHAGNLLIADILNARIRRIDGANGIISTIAGTGDFGDGGPANNAILSVPGDLVYHAGKVYVADYGTRRIRCIDLKTRLINTVAGGGTRTEDGILATEAKFALPEGLAIDPRGALYVADNILNRVMRVDLQTGIIRTVVGGGRTEAKDQEPASSVHLSMPSAMAVGPDGLLYVGEFGARKIWIVDPEKQTIRGLQLPAIGSTDSGLAITSLDINAEGLFVLIHGSNALYQMDLKTGAFRILQYIGRAPASLSGDSQVIDIAVRNGQAFLADALGHRVLRVNLYNSDVSVVAGNGAQGFGGDGGPADQAMLFQPGGVAVSEDGRQLFIADTKNHRIRRVVLDDPGEVQ